MDQTIDYETRFALASEDQGITELVKEMRANKIEATIAQTGGFTMCAYIELKDGHYIYANPYGASVYNSEDYEKDIVQFNEPQTPKTITSAVWAYLQQ